MRKILIFSLLLFVKQLYCQDIEFSQYYANPIYLNPAFAGSDEHARIALNYRTILPTSFGDYTTYSASIDKYYDKLSGGVGFQILNDRQAQGIINDLGVNLIYSYHSNLKKRWSLATGFKIGYNQKTINGKNLVYPDMITSTGEILPGIESGLFQQSAYFDFSFGMVTWYDNYYAGLSIDHLTKPIICLGSDNPGPLDRKYTLHGGMEIPFYNTLERIKMTVSPNVLIQMQGSSSKINLGLYLNKNYFTSGVWLKTNTQVKLTGCVFMLGYITDYFNFAYSYDAPFYNNSINYLNSGAHEVTFLYKFMYKSKRKKIKAIKCPKI